ncbi:transcriptional regulator [Streptomyces sp. AJS327]|uniref:ArsR/SmtB family transcription factor n=1 Tax=Streptomyces sp. AJS327 TaxID=2545265 RepID=UPI0015DE61FB|nr:metalloregulator ArsR/SmtB family transcription factor [Streptomyces sp. AJS327]MBA0050137.1 transcriptional regulator [Streptomyces sp. AJS327]
MADAENGRGARRAPSAPDAGPVRDQTTSPNDREPAVSSAHPPIAPPDLTAEDARTLAAVFRALADPLRLLLFSRVAAHPGGEMCVTDLGEPGVPRPTVSRQLRLLRQAGLLSAERRGAWTYYRVVPGALAALHELTRRGGGAPTEC